MALSDVLVKGLLLHNEYDRAASGFRGLCSKGQWMDKVIMQQSKTVHRVIKQAEPELKPVDLEKVVGLLDLKKALDDLDHPLKATSQNTVFSDGDPNSKIMVIGEAPGQEEDIQGKPFVGQSGQLLSKLLEAVDLQRFSNDCISEHLAQDKDYILRKYDTKESLENDGNKCQIYYITNIVPWRPPGNRTPTPKESAFFLPFVKKHMEIIAPKLLVLVGNTSYKAFFPRGMPITKIHGSFLQSDSLPCPAFIVFHPSYLLRVPGNKKFAWRDMLILRRYCRESVF